MTTHKVKSSITKKRPEVDPLYVQNTTGVQAESVGLSSPQTIEADNYVAKLQSENITLRKEIVNISNNVIPEALSKKDRQIETVQKEKAELEQLYNKEIQQLKSTIARGSFVPASTLEQLSNDPQYLKKQVAELMKKMLPKVYEKDLLLEGAIALPVRVHFYPRTDECMIEVNQAIAKEVFAKVCKGLG